MNTLTHWVGTIGSWAVMVLASFGQSDAATAGVPIGIDQVGYRPNDAKVAWLSGPGSTFSKENQ